MKRNIWGKVFICFKLAHSSYIYVYEALFYFNTNVRIEFHFNADARSFLASICENSENFVKFIGVEIRQYKP